MEDYAVRRKEYVEQIRRSFDEEKESSGGSQLHNTARSEGADGEQGMDFIWLKVRWIIAVVLFAVFLFYQGSGMQIGGVTAETIRERISDNQYYTKVVEYMIK